MAEKKIGPVGGRRTRGSGRAMLIVTVVGIVAVAITAAIFAFSRGTRQVTESALSLHQADDTLRVATVARYQLGFAVHLAGLDREFGSDFSAVADRSLDEASSALDQLEVGMADLERLGADFETRQAVLLYAATAQGIVNALKAGDSINWQVVTNS